MKRPVISRRLIHRGIVWLLLLLRPLRTLLLTLLYIRLRAPHRFCFFSPSFLSLSPRLSRKLDRSVFSGLLVAIKLVLSFLPSMSVTSRVFDALLLLLTL
ncbi:hypothetical protein Mapa_009518 [Marchantia paleacea]|nr:hypothetical protein Mapa_009518 [Marchantia paleacea]